GPDDLRPQIVSRWRRYLERRAPPEDPVFGPWHDLMRLPASGFAESARAIVARWRSATPGVAPGQINPLVRAALAVAPLGGGPGGARRYGAMFKHVYGESKKSSPAGLTPAHRQLLDVLTGEDGPGYFPKRNTYLYMSRTERDAYGQKLLALDK